MDTSTAVQPYHGGAAAIETKSARDPNNVQLLCHGPHVLMIPWSKRRATQACNNAVPDTSVMAARKHPGVEEWR